MENLNILSLPDGFCYVVLCPAEEGGFRIAMYNKINPINGEIVCMARGMIEVLANSTEGVVSLGQQALARDNTIEGEATEIEELLEPKMITKDVDLKEIEPLGNA